jgi:hypothetical protein
LPSVRSSFTGGDERLALRLIGVNEFLMLTT